MNIHEQITNRTFSKLLRDKGIKQEGIFWWGLDRRLNYEVVYGKPGYFNEHTFSAFTASELGEMLPEKLNKIIKGYNEEYPVDKLIMGKEDGWYIVKYQYYDASCSEWCDYVKYSSQDEVSARVKMLIHIMDDLNSNLGAGER